MTAPHVLHLISSLRVGGAERLLVSTMAAAKGHPAANFVIVIMNDEIDPGFAVELEATGFPVYRLGRREGHLHPRYLMDILSIVRRHRIDIVHTHNDGSRMWGMLARLLMPRLRLVYTVHAEGIGREITGLRRQAYLRLVDGTVAISGFVQNECVAFGARNVVQIDNGVDLAAFRAAPHAGAAESWPRLINVARFAHIKGQDVLIEALRLCHDRGHALQLILAGSKAEPEYFDSLVRLVAERGLGAHVHFVMDRTDIPNVLPLGDVFVLPSRHEGFGLVLIEAMAAGLPVIAARTGGAAELVNDGINGMTFEPENPQDLADRILDMAGNRNAAAAYAQAGSATADRYGISATLDKHLVLYGALLTPA